MENISELVLSPAKGQKLLIDLYFEPLSPHSKPPKCLAPRREYFAHGLIWVKFKAVFICFRQMSLAPFGVTLLFPSRFLEKQ